MVLSGVSMLFLQPQRLKDHTIFAGTSTSGLGDMGDTGRGDATGNGLTDVDLVMSCPMTMAAGIDLKLLLEIGELDTIHAKETTRAVPL